MKKALKRTTSTAAIMSGKAQKLVPDATPLNLVEAAKRNKAQHSYTDDGSNMSEEQKLAVANASSLMSEAHAAVVSGTKQTERGRAYITATMVSMIKLELVTPLSKAILDSSKGRNTWLTSFCEVIGQDYEAYQTAARTESTERAYVQALRDSQVTAAFLLKRNLIDFAYTNAPEHAALGEYRSLGMTKTGQFILNKAKLPGIVEGSGISGTEPFSISAISKMARKGESTSTGDTMLLRRINSLKEELNKSTLTKLTTLERNALGLLAVSITNCITRVDAQNAADKANAEKVQKSKADSAARAAAAHAAKMAKDKKAA